jgi:UMF1 family MFS transporter
MPTGTAGDQLTAEARTSGTPQSRRVTVGQWSWAVYDWANSPVATVIVTFVFPAYFQAQVVGDAVRGQALWGYTMAASALLLALLAPVLGAIADESGRRKPWIFAFTWICALAAGSLWFVEPSTAWLGFALAFVFVTDVAFDFAVVFANAMLPEIVPQQRLGRLSGWAWSLGYAGGLAALLLVLVILIWPERPLFSLDEESFEHVRASGPFVGLWLLLFSAPLFLFTPDRPQQRPFVKAVSAGLKTLGGNLDELRKDRNALLFLLAHMLYADGLTTIFVFGGLYASGVFGLSFGEVIFFGIAMNAAAGLGALAFAWVDDWRGSKQALVFSLLGLIAGSIIAVAATSRIALWAAGLTLGLFVGPAQASSRSLMARIAPVTKRASYFGLFSLSGQATAFVGPAAVATITQASGSQRAGLAVVLALFFCGLALLLRVHEQRAPP